MKTPRLIQSLFSDTKAYSAEKAQYIRLFGDFSFWQLLISGIKSSLEFYGSEFAAFGKAKKRTQPPTV